MTSPALPRLPSAAVLLTMLSLAAPTMVAAPADSGKTTAETHDERTRRMAWWRDARFGMFIHWGVYAVPAGYYQGKKVDRYSEWIMQGAKIPLAEYRTYADQFNPTAFDARAWVRAARAAGMRYIVITAKHHDGFAMFPSAASDWNITATPFKRDPLKELADACREERMPLGFYYSQAQDWTNGGAVSGGQWDDAQGRDMDAYLKNIAVPQVRELLTNYGPDVPAVLWWDTPNGMTEKRAQLLDDAVRAIRPDLITNNRLFPGSPGDILTPEQFIPAAGYPGRDWETCMTMNDDWGYRAGDTKWKSASELIRNLIDIVSKGGNYLLNVGPDATGRIPKGSLDGLAEIGRWMTLNGESIHGTEPLALQRPLAWGRGTRKGNVAYLHVFDWPKDGKLDVPLADVGDAQLTAAWLLEAPTVPLEVARTATSGLQLTLPPNAPDAIASVIKLEFDDLLPAPGLPVNQPAANGTITLPADTARVFDPANPEVIPSTVLAVGDSIDLLYWRNPAEAAQWHVAIPAPGRYRVRMQLAVAAEAAGSPFEITLGDARLEGKVPSTGSWNTYAWHDIGALEVASAGSMDLRLQPRALTSPVGFLNLKALELVPDSPKAGPARNP